MATVQVRGIADRVVNRVNRLSNVLMIGGASYTTRFVTDLAKQMSSERVTISCLGLGDQGAARSEVDRGGFARQFLMPAAPARPRTVRQATRLIPALLRAAVMREPSWAARASAHVRRPFRQTVARRMNAGQCRAALGATLSDYDIYHYHSLETGRLPVLWVLPSDAPVVLSVWGSDLLRSAGTLEYADQLAACERATVITVTSIEIREILLSKFGRHLAPKIRQALLGVSLLDEIDRCRGTRDGFLQSSGVSPERVTICIGNNASPGNQHLEVIDRLSGLPERYRQRVTLLVPLSYRQADRAYRQTLRLALQQGPLSYRMFDSPLSDREVAMLRCATDMLVHVPVSDAFSASMLETLYAGGVLITGAWLPYSELRRAQISFEPIATLGDLTGAVASALDHLDARRRAAADNRRRIRALVHPSETVRTWISIYDEVLGTSDAGAAS
jgi:hypothetical protein